MFRTSKDFRRLCKERVASTFAALGLEVPLFYDVPGHQYAVAELKHRGQIHKIEVYDDDVVMLAGKSLFECYMRDEWQNEDTLISGFTTRLTRYLSGGSWEGPNEERLPYKIGAAFKRLWRR